MAFADAVTSKVTNKRGFCCWIVVSPLEVKSLTKLNVSSACVASIARLAYSVKTVNQTDITWTFDPVVLWTYVSDFSLSQKPSY